MDLLSLILLALALSGYFAALEIAYTTFDAIIVGGWKKAGKAGSSMVEFFATTPERFLITTLVGYNLVTVAYSSLVVLWAREHGIPESVIVVLSPLAVIVFGELIPKTIGLAFANPIVRFCSLPLYVFFWLFWPFRVILSPLERFLKRSSRPESGRDSRTYDALFRREIDTVLSRASKEGTVTEKESEILDRYIHAREVRARDVMTPRTLLISVPETATVSEVLTLVEDTRHSVIPVYGQSEDDIVGFLHSRDLLKPRESIREIIRPAIFVPESKLLVELIEQFRLERISAAIVVDEHGGTDGILTRKDLFRELVGPLRETEDERAQAIKRVAAGRYLVSALADLSDIAEETGWRPPDGDYATLSGLLAEELGHIGKPGEEIEIEGVTIRVLRSSAKRVESCLLKLPQNPGSDQQ